MLPDLDTILRSTKEPEFKSRGERRIAEFLDQCGVRYMYEAPVAVQHKGQLRVWYPDFHLPDLGIHIEYFGVQADPSYDRGIMQKTATYAENGVRIISVYPCHLPHLPQYLTREIRENANYQRHLADAMFFRAQRGHPGASYRD